MLQGTLMHLAMCLSLRDSPMLSWRTLPFSLQRKPGRQSFKIYAGFFFTWKLQWVLLVWIVFLWTWWPD